MVWLCFDRVPAFLVKTIDSEISPTRYRDTCSLHSSLVRQVTIVIPKMTQSESVPGTKNTILATNYSTHCHKPDCSWLLLPHLARLKNPLPVLPNPELSGRGVSILKMCLPPFSLLTVTHQVILGFSITAYITLGLLTVHYLTVHNVRSRNVVNVVVEGLLTFFRHRKISWKPSRRFEYAMEKSVLILSETQLVTGLGILAAGYSQLKCGISAYHWQMIVFVAWFASFSFLSAMTFLEGYFQTNNSMRLIRVGFMLQVNSWSFGQTLPLVLILLPLLSMAQAYLDNDAKA
jgi:hypothetical protein